MKTKGGVEFEILTNFVYDDTKARAMVHVEVPEEIGRKIGSRKFDAMARQFIADLRKAAEA